MSRVASRTLMALGAGSAAVVLGLAGPAAANAVMTTPAATSAQHSGNHGADVSWPNCPKGEGLPSRRSKGEPMPGPAARFVVVGLTNGPGFHPNPCLARQLAWVASHHRQLGGYAMTTYPTAAQIRQHGDAGPFAGASRTAALRNAGYAEAVYNLHTMSRLGLRLPMIWVDVEPYPVAPWTRHIGANRAIIAGAIRGYHDAGHQVGIYTYANGWRAVVGSWQLPRYPTWVTAGRGSAHQARAMCSRGPSGGRAWLAQWYSPHRDYDLRCPAAPRRLGRMFVSPNKVV
jgi:hypothetical protein